MDIIIIVVFKGNTNCSLKLLRELSILNDGEKKNNKTNPHILPILRTATVYDIFYDVFMLDFMFKRFVFKTTSYVDLKNTSLFIFFLSTRLTRKF